MTQRMTHAVAIAAATAACSVVTPGISSADPADALTGAVTTIRGSSKCPSLQPDPLVERAARMAAQATSDYIAHRSAAVPFTDPMPALKTLGYQGSKALLISGYGDNEADAIHGLILEGRATIPDCAYTQYGASALQDSSFVITSVVLAAP